MRAAIAVLISLALPVTGAERKRIGEVRNIQGNWCRKATPLNSGDPIYLDDNIHYCSSTLGQDHGIEIQFDRNPPYVRTYACRTPGICDQQANLWLLGAYMYGDIAPGNWTPLISAVKLRHSLLPDSVVGIKLGSARLPARVLAALSDESLAICHISNFLPAECIQDKPTDSDPVIHAAPGLYGIYSKSALNATSLWQRYPNALLLIAPVGSDLPDRWNMIPEAFRNDTSTDSIVERRMFLLDLLKKERR